MMPAIDVDTLRALQSDVGADDATMEGLVGRFLDEGGRLLALGQQAAQRGDQAEAARAAHTLKSLARTFGAAMLAQLCADAEHLATEGDTRTAARRLAEASAEHERVRAALTRPAAQEPA